MENILQSEPNAKERVQSLESSDGSINFDQIADAIEQSVGRERLLEEVVGTCGSKISDFIVFDHTRDTQDADRVHRAIGANALANFATIDVGQHHVEDDAIRAKLFDLHARIEAVVGGADFEAAIAFEGVVHQVHQVLIVIDDEQFLLAAFEGVGGDTVVLHKNEQLIAWNPAKTAAGNSEAFQRSVVEATNDCLLAHLANLGGLAGRKNGFCAGHWGIHPS